MLDQIMTWKSPELRYQRGEMDGSYKHPAGDDYIPEKQLTEIVGAGTQQLSSLGCVCHGFTTGDLCSAYTGLRCATTYISCTC